MRLEPLFQNRGAVLCAGLALGAVLLSAFPTAMPVQGQDDDDPPTTGLPEPQPMIPAFGTADSNGSMIAVTGIDLTGSSILYLIDTKSKHLAIYQANGGAESTHGVKLVGARRIDLDLQLDGFNDKSEYSVQELERKFSDIGRASPSQK